MERKNAAAAKNRRYKATSDHTVTRDGNGRRVARLDADQCAQARRMHAGFKSKHAIAAHFGVSAPIIAAVIARTYKPRDIAA